MLDKNGGYTLLEIIITMGIIAIAIGTASFGLSVIFGNNVNSHASELVNEIRTAQTRQMASSTKTYDVSITHDGSNYVVKTYVTESAVKTEVKSTKFSNKLSIWKYDGSNYIELSTISDPTDILNQVKTFRFSGSSGKLISSAYGDYLVKSDISDVEVNFFVVKENGRVFIE